MKKKTTYFGKNSVRVFVHDSVICLYLELVELVVSFEIEPMNACTRHVWHGTQRENFSSYAMSEGLKGSGPMGSQVLWFCGSVVL